MSVSSKFKNSWISSSFDDFSSDDFAPKQPPPNVGKSRKRLRNDKPACPSGSSDCKPNPLSVSDELWVDKYAPLTQANLAVHKKKIAQVELWLQQSILGNPTGSCMLLLTGPSGCGKTAAVRVFAREMGLELCEWTNPSIDPYVPASKFSEYNSQAEMSAVGGPWTESQSRQFQDFLLRANKYPTLAIFQEEQRQNRKKLILVEDFPNNFFRDPGQLHVILRNYRRRAVHCPLVFVISDSCSGDSVSRKLLPPELQTELRIDNISFNPVAITSMVKVLGHIASQEALQSGGTTPSKSTIDQIANASAGDIRAAVNALQFTLLRGSSRSDFFAKTATTKLTGTKGKRAISKSSKNCDTVSGRARKSSSAEGAADLAVGTRDNSLFLFRALGKILYCKRGSISEHPEEASLPPNLHHHQRDPLLIDPEDVIERSHMSAELFAAYLHQNYVDFYEAFDDVVAVSDYFSDADMVTADWVSRPTMRLYSGSVASRAVAFCNTARSTSKPKTTHGWKPLHKPQSFTVHREFQNGRELAQSLFKELSWSRDSLHAEILPFLSLISTCITHPAQIAYLKKMNQFRWSTIFPRCTAEVLDEREVADDSGNSEFVHQVAVEGVPADCNLLVAAQDEETKKDECEIEEFSD